MAYLFYFRVMKNILFVCRANVDRSKTAEDFFTEQFNLIEFKSAGIDKKECNVNNTNYISQELINWSDMIFVMEAYQQDWIEQNLHTEKKEIVILDIPDQHTYYSIRLIEELQRKCNKYFES